MPRQIPVIISLKMTIMNKQIKRRIEKEGQKLFPFGVEEDVYGHTHWTGKHDEYEAFMKGAEAMFRIMLYKSCEYWEAANKWTGPYREAMEN